MKNLLFIAFCFILISSTNGQQLYIEANISKDCESQPGTISIEKNLYAIDFKIINIKPGVNCYNGNHIKESGFKIKNGSGEIVYTSSSSKKLSELKLQSGIYNVYVEGGRGAFIKLEYQIQSKYP